MVEDCCGHPIEQGFVVCVIPEHFRQSATIVAYWRSAGICWHAGGTTRAAVSAVVLACTVASTAVLNAAAAAASASGSGGAWQTLEDRSAVMLVLMLSMLLS